MRFPARDASRPNFRTRKSVGCNRSNWCRPAGIRLHRSALGSESFRIPCAIRQRLFNARSKIPVESFPGRGSGTFVDDRGRSSCVAAHGLCRVRCSTGQARGGARCTARCREYRPRSAILRAGSWKREKWADRAAIAPHTIVKLGVGRYVKLHVARFATYNLVAVVVGGVDLSTAKALLVSHGY